MLQLKHEEDTGSKKINQWSVPYTKMVPELRHWTCSRGLNSWYYYSPHTDTTVDGLRLASWLRTSGTLSILHS